MRRLPLLLVLASACGGSKDATMTLPARPAVEGQKTDDAPVPLDANPPVVYPAALLAEGISGTTVLRLFVDGQGSVVRESTTVQESSGFPALDSAALAAAPKLRYAPALQGGIAVAALVLQPITFTPPAPGVRRP